MIVIAVGANLPGPGQTTPLETCQAALRHLAELPGLRLVACSRWYASAPIPPSGQPDYINGVARLEGQADPADLLAWLHDIEQAFGRVRGAANAARTLDLDIIAMGDAVRAAPDPVLPHPRAHLRAFVLLPLAELAPDWVHPVLGQGVSELIASLPPQEIRPL